MGWRRARLDVGAESPREDMPWRGIPMKKMFGRNSNGMIMINPASCVMGGLDYTSMYPIQGLGIPFEVGELDFVWLAVYFDSNLRPIHAGIQKGIKFTRWYEYGAVSFGGFPRSIKTVRRDQVGSDIGQAYGPNKEFVLPDVIGPEIEYVEYETQKEIEWLSPWGWMHKGAKAPDDPLDTFTKALKSELTYYISDPIQTKQWAAYTLLGYGTSTPPDTNYPFPNTELSKTVGAATQTYWYRQTCSQHLMLQEVNAGGVRANQLVPSFPPYMEALPHPFLTYTVGGAGKVYVSPADGMEGALPSAIVNHADYEGVEIVAGNMKSFSAADKYWPANAKVRISEPGENAQITKVPAPVIGHLGQRTFSQSFGGATNFLGETVISAATRTQPVVWNYTHANAADSMVFWTSKGSHMDSVKFTLRNDRAAKQLWYIGPDGKQIPMTDAGPNNPYGTL